MTLLRSIAAVLAVLTVIALAAPPAVAIDIRMSTTTRTEASGLLSFLLPPFEAKCGCKVRVIAVGTGKALEIGKHGDVDVVLVHARQAEDRFVAEGHGVNRRDVMYNDFIIVGPESDPAAVRGIKDVLTISAEKRAYTLTDRATYGAYRSRIGLAILVEGDPRMFNPYGIIAVNPQHYPGANFQGAIDLINWITSAEGQRRIAEYKVNGEQLFFPSTN